MSLPNKCKPLRALSQKSRRPNNALQAGILAYLTSSHHAELDIKLLPKKYTLYPPLLILPVNFNSASPDWQIIFEGLSPNDKHDLFSYVAGAFKPQKITHIAINAAISPEKVGNSTENIMRSPSGIMPVYGDFGPKTLLNPNSTQPTQADFDGAFWISATQNGGIVQTWAPLWTMFSRGNIAEKARILGGGSSVKGLEEKELGEALASVDVADLYVGIGYFAFSYLKRGAGTVFGWDINAWSVEGLRRGCLSNEWNCFVAKLDENGDLEPTQLVCLVHFLKSDQEVPGKCVAFLGDNKSASRLLAEIDERTGYMNARHINLGLLPTARASWQNAAQVLNYEKRGWLHVHENVDVKEIDSKRTGMVETFESLVHNTHKGSWHVSCCHVEQVKTYAPGVMHCVFDIEITPIYPK